MSLGAGPIWHRPFYFEPLGEQILIGIGILTAIVLLWFLLRYWLNPHVEAPDGKAHHRFVRGHHGALFEVPR